MIQQFVALGKHFLQRDAAGNDAASYAQDPSRKFRSKYIYLLLFSKMGFDGIQVEEYSEDRVGWYLYRAGPSNGCDATPTSGLPAWKPGDDEDFRKKVTTRLKRLPSSIKQAITLATPTEQLEMEELRKIAECFSAAEPRILSEIKKTHPNPRESATLSVGWQDGTGHLKRVGDYAVLCRAIKKAGVEAAGGKKTQGRSSGTGQCSVCGAPASLVFGGLQIPHFKFYTLDKRGSVSGGFDSKQAWRNFPACAECCRAADYAGDKVKATLAFRFYGFTYLVLPLPTVARETEVFEMLDGLIAARMNSKAARRLTDAEDEILYVISEEKNRLQVDLLFYRPDPTYFRPELYVAGLLPTQFRKLFDAKEKVDFHPLFRASGVAKFVEGEFTFGSLRNVLREARGSSNFDADFLTAVRSALELRSYPADRLLGLGMRWVRQGFAQRGRIDESALADLTRTLMFFNVLAGEPMSQNGGSMTSASYSDSPQADRVRAFFADAPGALRTDPTSQAAFLVGACCKRIMDIQERVRGARPFLGKLKGLRLTESDLKRLLPEATEKAEAYGEDNRRKVSGLLECAGAALLAAGDGWELSPDEVSYYFALGLVLAPRLAAANNSEDV